MSWIVPLWAMGNDWDCFPLKFSPEPGEEDNDL